MIPIQSIPISRFRSSDSDPVDSDPVDSDPVDSDPVDSDPVDSDPVDSDPVSTGAQSIRNISILLSNPLTSERRRRDKITGTIGDDLFLNGLGADRFKGRGGTDVFLFDRKEKYGKSMLTKS